MEAQNALPAAEENLYMIQEGVPAKNLQKLNDFLSEFRAADLKSKQEDMRHILKACAYCGKSSDEAPIIEDRFNKHLCSSCKSELVWQHYHCQRLADETTHNIEQLFSISWKKHIRVKKLIGEVPSDMVYVDESAGSKWLREIITKCENWWDNCQNSWIGRKIPFWKTKHNTCNVKIRVDTPEGTVVAKLVYLVLSDYMAASSLDPQTQAGIVVWCMVHYLAVMDYMRYAVFYEKTLENASGDGGDGILFQSIGVKISALAQEQYKEFHEIADPCTAPIIPLQYIIAQFVPET